MHGFVPICVCHLTQGSATALEEALALGVKEIQRVLALAAYERSVSSGCWDLGLGKGTLLSCISV